MSKVPELSDMPVQFLPGHPHAGEYGIPTGKSLKLPGGKVLVEFSLVNCRHGVEACYASQGEAWLLRGSAKAAFDCAHGKAVRG